MNENQVVVTLTICCFLAIFEVLFGILYGDSDLCPDYYILMNLPFWSIQKGCITINLTAFLYAYLSSDNELYEIYIIWILIALDLTWIIIGCINAILWEQCGKYFVEILMWGTILLGIIMFIINLKLLQSIQAVKNERRRAVFPSLFTDV